MELGLRWGIKNSFVQYVTRMPDGQVALSEGAEPSDGGGVLFPPIQGARRITADGVEERIFAFGGVVRFSGHFGMLSVYLAFPAIEVRDGVGELTVVDTSKSEDGQRLVLADLVLQEVPAEPGLLAWTSTEVRMSAQASALFNDVYQPGEPFDQLTVVLPDR